ncbi:MAG: pimeloyl-ACP methyl ester carboxylesterase [Paracoccaceae bacterium]|jgi:pimeloyl-ACP methyl ester carboxylesterase
MIEPLVLIPEMMCDVRVFLPQLIAMTPGRAVMVAPITRAERIEDIAKNLLHQLPERFALAGLSMGGVVALEVLRRVPERVSRICLMSTNPLAETPAAAAMREPMIIGAAAGRLDDVMRETMPLEHLASGPERLNVLNLVYEMARDLGPDVFVAQSRALQRRPDQQGTLRRCKVPALVLCGEQDILTPPKRHEFMANLIPNATLAILPGAGHLPTLEQPELTTEALQNWLTDD